MENKATDVWTAFGVVSLVILLLGLFIWFLSYFIQSDFALALLGLAGAITTASFQYRAAKDRETEIALGLIVPAERVTIREALKKRGNLT